GSCARAWPGNWRRWRRIQSRSSATPGVWWRWIGCPAARLRPGWKSRDRWWRCGSNGEGRMRQRVWWLALGVVLAGCSEQKPAPKRIVPVAVKVSDEGRRFPSKDQAKIEVVNQKLLGKDFLPGGNLAEYKLKGKTYQQFLVRAETPDKAAFL